MDKSLGASVRAKSLTERSLGSRSSEEDEPGFGSREASEADVPHTILGGPAQGWALYAIVGTCLAVIFSYWVLTLNQGYPRPPAVTSPPSGQP